jgi:hypothetical protein
MIREINDLCRFYMDMSISRELDVEELSSAPALPEKPSA